ncbi:similar to Saccharomyces cerevisiae YGL145W TIP20 Peripheral membrane protein required for fusion of COPI vesicles with the ER [Maudiozyma saulgeensis]|uniref:Similar to Saccharomyces cerevisiae YGL145W TIP20 Peripheral membrane protein required for fusion of COPI vesicles with the ER n=1 Tax=Maudiozyma saulgeensis TaxID=1789683 RepID=A0A1X7R145_9SACH|nr:similar to Saccharomyces cerevisiae YGL145W TIP20 Peripheral membrane protein required for fusion of COPI vesicles with the ER [Kazachstania saulgeensis]
MLSNVKDLLEIDTEIGVIDEERSNLAIQLSTAQQKILSDSEKISLYRDIADRIENCEDISEVQKLRAEFGNLKVFDELEVKFTERSLIENRISELERVKCELDELISKNVQDLSFYEIAILHGNLKEIADSNVLIESPLLTLTMDSFDKRIISRYAEYISIEYNQQLFNSKWDTEHFVLSDTDTVERLNKTSSLLFKLTQLYFNPESQVMWNFISISNNFKIRFTYHFHNDSSTINLYFKFLNDYLKNNLYKCISIFEDESIGLTKQLIHEEFINHILDPIREKINITLLQNDVKTFITLISQIISTDKNLASQYFYRGKGLISLVSEESWNKWLQFEITTSKKQFETITNSPKELIPSVQNFCKLLKKVYDYLEPFYGLNYDNLDKLKLKTCSQIFLHLSAEYLEYVMTTDSLDENHNKIDELFQTMTKLQILNVVYSKIYELSQQFIFIELTTLVNESESKRYVSVFQDVLNSYRDNMENDLQGSIIHRIQKLSKDALQNYFKINTWINTEPITDENITPTAEVVNCITMLKRVISNLDTLNIPQEISINIKNELLNRLVNYFVESILKLNKFNSQGLLQFETDFKAVKDTLNLPDGHNNYQSNTLKEILTILRLKYDSSAEKYIQKSYIKNGEFSKLKQEMNIQLLNDSEIQDALYRIQLNNIV